MSIHLIGGGWAPEDDGALYRPFLAEAAARAAKAGRSVPRVAVVFVRESAEELERFSGDFITMLSRGAEFEPVPTMLLEGQTLDSTALSAIDGLLIGGGRTPAYLEAVGPIVNEIRLLVSDGLPYLGFSAGAMIASDTALLGGWRIGGVPVCPQNASEDLDEVTVAEGLGLVDLAIDVHAAQWGTLSRIIAATEAGIVDGGVAIDEYTVLIIGQGALRVEGAGSVWRIGDSDTGVVVGTLGA
ncbi:Type 1 glutamine amidotransferase-like domain-containing protein [Salinibacterium sp. ZJ450]|uniref:Type 1 glutamine amidotransferase-like domain-containing protein n=1 Tax=Salinibacterium sp. ZJ450 TaxID=2708338 RepID=UPI00141D7E24|nr:Type 1 glutamine amidotransferase-like domain-containing protein [Salinibacterium sp. ZJ450]